MKGLAILLCSALALTAAAEQPPLPPGKLRSGIAFSGADVRAMQMDDLQNPGMLWVERGAALWATRPADASRACADCHREAQATMKGVAARYPGWDAREQRVVDLEDRINACRVRHMDASPLARESDDLLALTALVANASRGMPIEVGIEGPAHAAWERGRAFYHQRHGQMNLSCGNCHDDNSGKRLLAETISQGHGNAWPAYRLEWQAQGSLQRRLRACLSGIRAEMPPAGAQELVELELYLAWRAMGLPIETPGVRR